MLLSLPEITSLTQHLHPKGNESEDEQPMLLSLPQFTTLLSSLPALRTQTVASNSKQHVRAMLLSLSEMLLAPRRHSVGLV